jgi:leucyl/phenylalanyl-tRNA---protein transferase
MPAIQPHTLLHAYSIGIFPMADSREDDEVYWVEPRRRAILPIHGFHLSRSLAKVLKSDRFDITVNRAFADVMDKCAEIAPDREESWINGPIRESYITLHQLGHASSVECWQGTTLVGGLYGVNLGRVFCGESMFSRATNASKVALATLVAVLRKAGYRLLDCQFMTSHLASLGAIEIDQADYVARLRAALDEGNQLYSAGAASDGAAGAGSGLLPVAPPDCSFEEAFGRVVAPVESGAGSLSSSPGKRISQFLIQTS